jgi:hypothetical protein
MRDIGISPCSLYSRREVLRKSGLRFGGVVLASLLGAEHRLGLLPRRDRPPGSSATSICDPDTSLVVQKH